MKVDQVNRLNTTRNHTATHLVQQALKDVLGNHIEQAGSSVNAERLRFDFTHFEPMTNEQIKTIKSLMNRVQNMDRNGIHNESYKDIRRGKWSIEEFQFYYIEMLKEWITELKYGDSNKEIKKLENWIKELKTLC